MISMQVSAVLKKIINAERRAASQVNNQEIAKVYHAGKIARYVPVGCKKIRARRSSLKRRKY